MRSEKVGLLNAQQFELGVEMLAVDSQDARGFGFVAAGARHRARDHAPLQTRDGLFEPQLHYVR